MTKFYVLIAFLQLSLFALKAQELETLPLFNISQLTYEGAFRIGSGDFGVSSINYSEGPIAYNSHNNSIFIVGHNHQQAIAEFAIPTLVKSNQLSDLNMVESPLQGFSQVLNKTIDGNREGIDKIGGLLFVNQGGNGKLVVNGYEYYDAPADNKQTTLIVEDASKLATSPINGYYAFDGGAGHTSGWLSPIPQKWQTAIGGTHITGQSSGMPIISRTSVGPSAFAFTISDALNATNTIATTQLLDFSLDNPLHADLSNDFGVNKIWTHLSKSNYGFIVPGTRTYLTLGNSGGHDSGVCYKCTQDNGNLCSGYCTPKVADNNQYYWLWDMNDLLAVRAGTLRPYEVRPYDFGIFNTPFQAGGHKEIGGGSFDPLTGNLYLSVQKGDTQQGPYAQPPVIVVYKVHLVENIPDEEPADPESPDENGEETDEPVDSENLDESGEEAEETVEPEDPIESGEETDEPVEPENPDETEDPVQPENPDESAEETDEPVDSENLDESGEEAEETVEPEDPDESGEETEEPVEPENPDEPGEPENLDESEEPVDPESPNETEDPVQPENPDESGEETVEPVDLENTNQSDILIESPLVLENPSEAIDSLNAIDKPSIGMYPNPTSEMLIISGLKFESYIQITDVSGKIVKAFRTVETNAEVDFTAFPTGIYAILIFNATTNALVLEKVVKRN